MSIIALYVYSPTTFDTDTEIETMTGASHAAGKVELPPGIYRLPAGAKLAPVSEARGAGYAVVTLDGTKGGWPDPPEQALLQHNKTAHQIKEFLGGAGQEDEI